MSNNDIISKIEEIFHAKEFATSNILKDLSNKIAQTNRDLVIVQNDVKGIQDCLKTLGKKIELDAEIKFNDLQHEDKTIKQRVGTLEKSLVWVGMAFGAGLISLIFNALKGSL